ncbi:MAG: sensor histidine kinase [Clostridia bacterium]|nr:sensor histidine kinase [Clostridia bacterium]MBR6006871.1 sensor histidine kinase [Clostridia bacterium]
MKELSLNILDIAQNSITAEADLVEITLDENDTTLKLSIKDNGYGMSQEFLASVADPFSTTRTTRKVGMGIPLLKLAAEQTGGGITLSSTQRSVDPDNCGTEISAFFHKDHLDFTPIGDIVSTICTLLQGFPDVDYVFTHRIAKGEGEQAGETVIGVDTRDMRVILGDDVPLNDPMVLLWVRDSLEEQYREASEQLG